MNPVKQIETDQALWKEAKRRTMQAISEQRPMTSEEFLASAPERLRVANGNATWKQQPVHESGYAAWR